MPETYCGADLDKVLADRLAVVHGVEGRDFVNAHRGNLEHASNLIHDADTSVAVLALAKVEQGHDGGLLVLGRITLKDLIDEGEVLLGELEREGRVVGRLITVLLEAFWLTNGPYLHHPVALPWPVAEGFTGCHTTLRDSLSR